jgi:hypothetical protein
MLAEQRRRRALVAGVADIRIGLRTSFTCAGGRMRQGDLHAARLHLLDWRTPRRGC